MSSGAYMRVSIKRAHNRGENTSPCSQLLRHSVLIELIKLLIFFIPIYEEFTWLKVERIYACWPPLAHSRRFHFFSAVKCSSLEDRYITVGWNLYLYKPCSQTKCLLMFTIALKECVTRIFSKSWSFAVFVRAPDLFSASRYILSKKVSSTDYLSLLRPKFLVWLKIRLVVPTSYLQRIYPFCSEATSFRFFAVVCRFRLLTQYSPKTFSFYLWAVAIRI